MEFHLGTEAGEGLFQEREVEEVIKGIAADGTTAVPGGGLGDVDVNALDKVWGN